MSERVYRLGRGPWHHQRVGFGVSLAARSIAQIYQISVERRCDATGDGMVIGVLEREDRCE